MVRRKIPGRGHQLATSMPIVSIVRIAVMLVSKRTIWGLCGFDGGQIGFERDGLSVAEQQARDLLPGALGRRHSEIENLYGLFDTKETQPESDGGSNALKHESPVDALLEQTIVRVETAAWIPTPTADPLLCPFAQSYGKF